MLEEAQAPQPAPVHDQPVRLGRIVSIAGSQVITVLDKEVTSDPAMRKHAPQIGALVTMRLPDSVAYGLVTGLSVPDPTDGEDRPEVKIMEVELLGEATGTKDKGLGSFQRGVSDYPALGDAIFASTIEDLSKVYAKPSVSCVRVGSVHQDKSLPAFIITDDLLGKHFAILGTTGSGKSCAVALILRAILSRHSNGHVLLLDPHNEYSRAFGQAAELVTTDDLELPYWLLNFEEIKEIILGGRESERESTILSEVVVQAKRLYQKEAGETDVITVDTPLPYRLSDVGRMIDDRLGKLDQPEDTAPYQRIKSRLATLQADRRFSFMFPGLQVRDNMDSILSRLFRIPVNGRPITILDLSGVPSEILNVVVSLLCRMTFDFAMWNERASPTLLVCEEAHRYASMDTTQGFEPTKRALARIAKEGRKYGVSLCVVTQRPSELAPGMLSQCSTIFSLRLSNQKDQEFVSGAMSESAIGLMDSLPSLRNAEAIVVGEGVSVPFRVCFDHLPDNYRPKSGTASFSNSWDKDMDDNSIVTATIERWRKQRRG